jgi:hypothetical protein
MIHPDDPNPFAQFIVDQTEINRVVAVCVFIALVLVAGLFGVLL